MYARYSTLAFDAERREEVIDHFRREGTSGPSGRRGWRGSCLLEPDAPGEVRTLTLWDSAEDFERFHAGPANGGIDREFARLGLRVAERGGASTVLPPALVGGHVRVVAVRIDAGRREEVERFWRGRGRALVLRQPGAVRAEAYWAEGGPTTTEATIIMEWADRAAAVAFVSGADHAEFAAGMGTAPGDTTHRRELDRITA